MQYRTQDEVIRESHASGAVHGRFFTWGVARRVVDHLMQCHGHVFIVDQAAQGESTGYTQIVMSTNALNCLERAGLLEHGTPDGE